MRLSSSHSLEHPVAATPVSSLQWRAEIGLFNAKIVKYPFKSIFRANACPRNLNKFYTMCCMFLLLLIFVGDIKLNPGPRKSNTFYNFSFYHWNLNSIAAYSFSKLSLLEAYNAQHNFDMICLSETFLDSSIPTNDEGLNMNGYKLRRADNAGDSKTGGVGIYYKKFLAVHRVEVKNLNEGVILKNPLKTKGDTKPHSIDRLVKHKMSLTFLDNL